MAHGPTPAITLWWGKQHEVSRVMEPKSKSTLILSVWWGKQHELSRIVRPKSKSVLTLE